MYLFMTAPGYSLLPAEEGVARRMNELEASELRGTVCNVLKRSKPPPPNITRNDRVALRTLKENENIMIYTDNGCVLLT